MISDQHPEDMAGGSSPRAFGWVLRGIGEPVFAIDCGARQELAELWVGTEERTAISLWVIT